MSNRVRDRFSHKRTLLLISMLCYCVDQQHLVVDEFLEVKEHNFVCLLGEEYFQEDHQKLDIPFERNELPIGFKFQSNDLPIEINSIKTIFLNEINA